MTTKHETGAAVSAAKAFPESRKVYRLGSRSDIRVPAREVAQSPTSGPQVQSGMPRSRCTIRAARIPTPT